MTRRIVTLDGAKEDFKDIKQYVKKAFGEAVWNEVNAEYKASLGRTKADPQLGSHVDELKALGLTNVRYALVRQTKIIYEMDESLIVIHMFIGTRRDFRAHLLKRLVSN